MNHILTEENKFNASGFTILIYWIEEEIVVRSGTESSFLGVIGCFIIFLWGVTDAVFTRFGDISSSMRSVEVMFMTITRWHLICWSRLTETGIKIDEYRWFTMRIFRTEVFVSNEFIYTKKFSMTSSYNVN